MTLTRQLPDLLREVLDALLEGHGLYEPEWDGDQVVALRGLYMNPEGLRLRGMDELSFLGSDLLERTLRQDNASTAEAYVHCVVTGEPMRLRAVVDQHSGQRRAYEVNGVRVGEGREALLSLSFRDVTTALGSQRRLQQTTQELAALAATDELTGLLNRRGWDTAFAQALTAAGAEGRPVSLAVADLDHFKAFNDEHGHPAGDALLQALGRAWRGELSAADRLARVGGEEFVVLLPGCVLEDARQVCQRLAVVVPGGTSVSIGVAQWDGAEAGQDLLVRADRALYDAKHAGRARVRTR